MSGVLGGPEPCSSLGEVVLVQLESNAAGCARRTRAFSGVTETEKGIHHGQSLLHTVQPNAPLRKLRRECRRVWAFCVSALDRFVGNKPVVSAAALVFSSRVSPTRDVAFIGIFDADSGPIERDGGAGFGEVKEVFVAVIHESFAGKRLE